MRESTEKVAQIFLQEDNGAYHFNEILLKNILLGRPELANMQVSVVSVAGEYRKGKSFLLNFFRRFLAHDGRDGWLEAEGDVLCGFGWHCGCAPNTKGILMWADPFVVTRKDGTKIAVILMDTQGMFDNESTTKDCMTIFALSGLCSSLQVLNISNQITASDLQSLAYFANYGELVLAGDKDTRKHKPFQKLSFLVRDWQYGEPGFEAGSEYLNNIVSKSGQHPEMKQVLENIHAVYEEVNCFLLPHPGNDVASNPTFKGELHKIDSEFLDELQVLVPTLLDPDNLVPKCINGQPVTCVELYNYFTVYFDILQSGTLPEPVSLLDATARAHQKSVADKCLREYEEAMDAVINTPDLTQEELLRRHNDAQSEAINLFKNTKKMGDEEMAQEFLFQLEQNIQEEFETHYLLLNEIKMKMCADKLDAEVARREIDMILLKSGEHVKEQELITKAAQMAAIAMKQKVEEMRRNWDNTINELNELKKQREEDELKLKNMNDRINAQEKAIVDQAKAARDREISLLNERLNRLSVELEQAKVESARKTDSLIDIVGGIAARVAGILAAAGSGPGMLVGAMTMAKMGAQRRSS